MPGQAVALDLVTAFAPARALTVDEAAPALGLTGRHVRMLRRIHGFERVRADQELGVIDLILLPAREALRAVPDPGLVRYVVLAHTALEIMPAGMDAAALVAAGLGLGGEAFALTNQYCASGLAAIDVAGELLRADGDPAGRALVLTGEKALPTLTRPLAKQTFIGEASAAVLVRLGGTGDWIRSYVTVPQCASSGSAMLSATALVDFTRGYLEDLATVITAAVARADLVMTDITMIVPHNDSRLAWRRIAEQLGLDEGRVFLDNLPRYGHAYCADPFVNLAALRSAHRLVKGGYYLLTSVGIGGAIAAMVIEH